MKRASAIALVAAAVMLAGCTEYVPGPNPAVGNILDRRSVREFTSQPIGKDTLDTLVRAAMAAPTYLDRRPWEFIVLDNEESVRSFFNATGNDRFQTATAAIVICADTTASQLWFIDCACAAENLLLASHSMGLGSVYTPVYPSHEYMKTVSSHLNLPDSIAPMCAIPVGHPMYDSHAKNKYKKSKIHANRW